MDVSQFEVPLLALTQASPQCNERDEPLRLRQLALAVVFRALDLARREVAAQVDEEETLAGIVDLAGLWVDAAPGRVLRIEVHAETVRVDLEDANGAIGRVELPRPHAEMPSAVVHDGVAELLANLDARAASASEG